MADLSPLLREIRGVYSDRARDRLPDGSVWEMIDWVPDLMQAGARIRGAWLYKSTVLPSPPDGLLYAPFIAGPKLFVISGSYAHDIPLSGAIGATQFSAAIPPTRQNPIFHRNRVVVPAADGVTNCTIITWDGINPPVPATGPGGAINSATGRYATVWKDRTVLANSNTQPSIVRYSQIGDPTIAFDDLSKVNTSYAVTGLAAQRAQVLCFHDSSVERLRGTTPPDSTLTDKTGDLTLDVLWDRAGCYDARSIAYWQDNVLFADARGIQLTDGSVVRNVTVQGGVINLWHQVFNRGGKPDTVAGGVYRDYYLCTLRKAGYPPYTFVVDIPNRKVFTIGNVDSACYAFSVATVEQLFGTNQQTKQVTDLTPVFDPDASKLQIDDNGTAVLPTISTGWDRLTRKPGFKRVIEAHVSYTADRDDNQEVLQTYYINSPIGADKALGQLRPSKSYIRRPVPIRRRMEGLGMKITQTLPTKDTRLFDISVRTYPEEPSRT